MLSGEVVSTTNIGPIPAVFVENEVQGPLNEVAYCDTYVVPLTPLIVTTGNRLNESDVAVADVLVV
jgi:hypothetical protein